MRKLTVILAMSALGNSQGQDNRMGCGRARGGQYLNDFEGAVNVVCNAKGCTFPFGDNKDFFVMTSKQVKTKKRAQALKKVAQPCFAGSNNRYPACMVTATKQSYRHIKS